MSKSYYCLIRASYTVETEANFASAFVDCAMILLTDVVMTVTNLFPVAYCGDRICCLWKIAIGPVYAAFFPFFMYTNYF